MSNYSSNPYFISNNCYIPKDTIKTSISNIECGISTNKDYDSNPFGLNENRGWKIGTLALIVLIIVLIVFTIWYLVFRNRNKEAGEFCTLSGDCKPYHYCSGANTCVSGGQGSNGYCLKTEDCQVGYTCRNGNCKTGGLSGEEGEPCQFNNQCLNGLVCVNFRCNLPNNINEPYGSFTNAYIITEINNATYYLNVSKSDSFWTKENTNVNGNSNNKPVYGFNYNSITNKLYLADHNGKSIAGILLSSDKMITTNINSGSKFVLKQNGLILNMMDQNERLLGSTNNNSNNNINSKKARFNNNVSALTIKYIS